jgi:hypothetical protein
MGKNNKKNPPVDAPIVDKKPEEKAPETKVEEAKVIDTTTKKGLSQEAKVNYLTELRMRNQELMGEDNPPLEIINGFNMIRDAVIIDIACGEIACGTSATGHILIANETNYKALQLAATYRGVKMPEFKALPRPTKAQLEAAGIAELGETRALPMKDIKPSKEAIEKKKKENKLNEDAQSGKKEYLNDPTKIETDDQLKEALQFQLSNTKIVSPLDRLIQSANFLRAYRDVTAEKSDNPEVEHAKNKELTIADLLQDISTMVPASFTAEGFGRLLCKTIDDSQSVIPAFEMLKRCGRKRNSTEFKYSDEEIAAMVRVLVVWKASAAIADAGKEIKRLTEKDAKKNAAAIETANAAIKKEQALMTFVTNPVYDLADNFIAAYNNKDHELHNSALAVFKSITETYYKGVTVPELEFETMLLNVQQHVGIDLNLFNEEMLKRDEYDEKNLIAFTSEEKPEEEEKADEGEKNA